MREVNPMDTDRAVSWQLYIDAPMPMVTIFKTLNITNLMKHRAGAPYLRRLRNNRPYDNRNVQSGKIRYRRRGEHVQRNFQ